MDSWDGVLCIYVCHQSSSSSSVASLIQAPPLPRVFFFGAPTSWLRGNATLGTMGRHLVYILGWKVVDPRGVGQLDSTTARMDIQGAATSVAPSRFAAKEAAAAATVWRTTTAQKPRAKGGAKAAAAATAPIAQTRACCEDSKTASSRGCGGACKNTSTASSSHGCAGGGGSCAAQEAGAGGSSDISAGAAAYQRLGRQNSTEATR